MKLTRLFFAMSCALIITKSAMAAELDLSSATTADLQKAMEQGALGLSFDTSGPMARSIYDVAAALGAMRYRNRPVLLLLTAQERWKKLLIFLISLLNRISPLWWSVQCALSLPLAATAPSIY